MTQTSLVKRRALLWAMAGAVFAVAPIGTYGQDKAAGDKAEPAAGKDGAADKGAKATAKKKGAVLKVIVVGDGKPVEKAEVKFWFPPSLGGDTIGWTNPAGEAEFSSTATGVAQVRVIADGWKTVLNSEVNLKEGSQQLTMTLTADPSNNK